MADVEKVESPSGDSTSVQFCGEQFRLNDDISEFAMLEFAMAAGDGQDGDTLQGLASLLRFVLELIHPDERDHFRALARKNRVKADDLIKVLTGEVEEAAERPTGRSSDSSDGPTVIVPKLESNSEGKVSPASGYLDRYKDRPDILLLLDQVRQPA